MPDDFERGRRAGLDQAARYVVDACRPILAVGFMAGMGGDTEGQSLANDIAESLSGIGAEILELPPESTDA